MFKVGKRASLCYRNLFPDTRNRTLSEASVRRHTAYPLSDVRHLEFAESRTSMLLCMQHRQNSARELGELSGSDLRYRQMVTSSKERHS